MKKELEQKLYAVDPVFFRQRDWDMTQTCMCWGIECGDGWFEPIMEFVGKVAVLNGLLKPLNMCIVASQIKSKWAEFTCYWNMDVLDSGVDVTLADGQQDFMNSIHGLMDDAVEGCVAKCNHTCELCGKHSFFEDEVFVCGSWLTVKCVECAQKKQREAGKITNFRDGFMFLSPFVKESIIIDGVRYRTIIGAYYGTLYPEHRVIFREISSPSETQSLAMEMGLCRDDETVFLTMRKVLEIRYKDEKRRAQLLSTNGLEIVQSNYNHENEWGSCWCRDCGDKGKNRYGRLLMEIRKELT